MNPTKVLYLCLRTILQGYIAGPVRREICFYILAYTTFLDHSLYSKVVLGILVILGLLY